MLIVSGAYERDEKWYKVCRICQEEKLLKVFPFRKANIDKILSGRDQRKLNDLRGPSVSNECNSCIADKIKKKRLDMVQNRDVVI